ncbi:hypothetical protein [Longimicrobium sp.]|uniref:hypothetical protein n=1 Tax=Longimicrobium sp. TaxID=2029185 RepID=UPI002E304753|nr:hypothetical protein [Longimicrobium sp.]HEX6038917.1 hypothetical protein [Longimicrobium sp.]
MNQAGLPKDRIADSGGALTQPWNLYLSDQAEQLLAAPSLVKLYQNTGLTSSLAAEDLASGGVSQGVYMIAYEARITTAAGVSSSLQLSFSWTRNGQTITQATTAYTGNSTGTLAATGSLMPFVDDSTPVTVATTLSTSGSPAAVYEMAVALIRVSA